MTPAAIVDEVNETIDHAVLLPGACSKSMPESRPIFSESLHRLIHAYQRAMREAFREHDIDLTVTQVRVLKCVAAGQGATVQSVALRMDSDRGQVARAIAQLRCAALVRQNDNEADRRMPLLAVTSKGHGLLERVIDIQAAAGQRMARGLSDADVSYFVSMAEQMRLALRPAANETRDGG